MLEPGIPEPALCSLHLAHLEKNLTCRPSLAEIPVFLPKHLLNPSRLGRGKTVREGALEGGMPYLSRGEYSKDEGVSYVNETSVGSNVT